MPNFTDFLWAPWKLISVLFGSSAPRQNLPGILNNPAAGNAGQSMCYFRDVGGGDVLSICRIGNYEMPSFVFWASFLIFLLFVAACALLLFQSQRLAKNLRAIEGGFRAMNDQPDLQQLRQVLAPRSTTRAAWEQLEASVVSDGAPAIFSRAPEDILSLNRLEEENIQIGFFTAVPGILTGLGLLMTFIAILDGLSHVTVSANMDVQGIGGLINGLSGKFVSSIVAVTCAVSFAFVERFAHSFTRQAHQPFMTQALRKIRRRTPEQLLAQIQAQLDAQAQQIQKLVGPGRS